MGKRYNEIIVLRGPEREDKIEAEMAGVRPDKDLNIGFNEAYRLSALDWTQQFSSDLLFYISLIMVLDL